MTKWQPINTAPQTGESIIVRDLYGFVWRSWWLTKDTSGPNAKGGWYIHEQAPEGKNYQPCAWIEFPELEFEADNGELK